MDECNKDKHLNILEQESSNKIESNDNHDNDILPSFINHKKIIYLPTHNIRKLKIADHIQMVTYDILEAFRPNIKNSERLLPTEINFNKESLDIITDSWKNNEVRKDNMKTNEKKSSIIPEDNPFRHMLLAHLVH